LPLGNVTAFTLTRCVGAIMGNPGANGVVSEALAQGSYYAFISYSHRDSAEAARIHKALETYRLPPKVGGSVRRLFPIFRDREELSAGGDLSVQVQAALAASQALIVLCSPDAAASQWVGKEIETFRALYPDRPILAALIAGEPDAAFHSALTENGVREPVAADFRKGGDGRRLAQLKLVAGMAGLGLDALVQRDAQRQFRRVTAITLASAAAVLAMAVLLVFALRAQSEAERQRAEAEGLVEYMLTDLRDRLKGVGRLDVMTAVNERAMAYYGKQGDLTRLPDESLERRARILHAMGEDDEKRGNLDKALGKFTEAHRATAAVLAKKPGDADAIFAHAQSEYWVGYAALVSNDEREALDRGQEYLRLAKILSKRDPASKAFAMEIGWAHNFLGAVKLYLAGDAIAATPHLKAYVDIFTALAEKNGRDPGVLNSLSMSHSFMAEVYQARGQLNDARRHRALEREAAEALLQIQPQNAEAWRTQMINDRNLARIMIQSAKPSSASIYLRRADATAQLLLGLDPANQDWIDQAERNLAVRKSLSN
jgi:tetratricopeptide (TPR) repeat protein